MLKDDWEEREALKQLATRSISNDERLRAGQALALYSLADAVRSLAEALTHREEEK